MSKTITSGNITFIDTTDSRKLDVYITSNLPTVQIFDANTETYSPNWSSTNLVLTADIYLDSKPITDNAETIITWFSKNEAGEESQLPNGKSLTITSNNALSNNTGIITYVCKAEYQGVTARQEITFTRIYTGVNGKDGTGVTILGSYNTLAELQAAHPTGNAGDAYIVDGDLYVWAIEDTQWENVGNIQGPKGDQGESAKAVILNASAQIFKVNKTGVVSPEKITVTAQTFNTTANNWTYSTNGGQTFLGTAPTGVSRNGNIVTITGSSLTSNSIVIKASDGTYSDTLTVYKVFDGFDGSNGSDGVPAPIAFLTNENITFGANENGQIVGMSFTTNVVAYSGTTKVTPKIGTITGLPTGMTVSSPTTVGNELILTFTIADNETLGSESSNNGTITIPITSPISTNLKLSWSKVNSGLKGDAGVGIRSTTVTYAASDSASTRPVDTAWQSTIPVVEEGKYLWTRTIIDYTDDAVADTVTYTYSKQGVKGDTGSSGSSVTISSIQYQEGASATTAPTGTWSNSVVTASEGKYLWTKTAFSDGKTAYGVAKQGISGKDGVGINSTTVDYGVSDSATVKPTTWQRDIPTVAEGKYLWTRTVTDYTDTTKADTVTYIYAKQGIKGDTGTAGSSVTVKSIKYQAGTSATTAPTGIWSDSVVAVAEGGYLWTQTTFSDNKVAYGVAKQGQKGDQGVQGPKGNDGQQYYTWVKYADTPTSGMSDDPTNKTYIGLAYNKTTATESTTYSDYAWSLIRGATGATGPKGADGQQYYTWIKYADNASGANMSDLPDGKLYIGLAYNKTTSTESNVASDYTWALFKGDKGETGAAGKDGSDAYTVMLTNESHIFAGDVSNAIAATATTQVLAYKGSTAQSVTITSVNGKTATTTDTDIGIAGLKFKCSALSGTSPTITFTCTTSFVSKSGSIPIILSVGGVQFTKMFTYSIAFKGATGAQGGTGTSASLVDITPSALYFKSTTGKDGAFTPDYIYLYPRFQTVTYSKWEYSINGGTTWVAASGANGLTIGTYNSIANTLRIAKTSTLYTDTVTSISFRCVSSNASVYDTVSIAKIYDVVDLQIEGRNLLLNSGVPVTNSTYNIKTYELATTPIVGETYTITLKGKLGEGKSHFSAYNSGGNVTLAALTKVEESDLYTKTFTWTNGGRTDLDKSVFIYVMANSTVAESTIEWIKLEKGTLATDWTPAPEDYKSVTFQIYAPNGYLLTNELQSLTLQTFAYDGGIEITSGATFQWSHLVDAVWTPISEATNTTLTVAKADVLKAKSYRCVMTYKSKTYTSTITVQDKTDTYNSIMCISSNATGNDCYWVLYTLVYSDTDEVDPLLGPISINTPSSPTSGDYWYAVDPTNATVTLKKYNGTSWANSTDTQSLSYYWDIINDGSASMPIGGSSKVKVISCHDFTGTATLVCKVNDTEDGLITQSSLSLTDVSDPIVSTTEPTGAVNGQIWIKPNENGTYQMFVWDEANVTWVTSDIDTRTKVYTSRPSSYNAGDLWITATDTDHGSYLQGTLLQAQTYNITYNAADWSPTLRYDQDIDSMKETLDNLSEYVSINSSGLRIGAKSNTGELSPFTSLFTSTELAFYQNSEKLLILANNQLTAPRVVVEDELEVQGSISLNDLRLVIENNGSYSFVVSQ